MSVIASRTVSISPALDGARQLVKRHPSPVPGKSARSVRDGGRGRLGGQFHRQRLQLVDEQRFDVLGCAVEGDVGVAGEGLFDEDA